MDTTAAELTGPCHNTGHWIHALPDAEEISLCKIDPKSASAPGIKWRRFEPGTEITCPTCLKLLASGAS